jgi:nucleoside phosphorylase
MTVGIQICSGSEWRATKTLLALGPAQIGSFPYGEHASVTIAGRACVVFHSHRTKTRAAGACQYAIDHWAIDPLLVLGTCGGVAERLRVGDIVFATRTVQWDCVDRLNAVAGPFLDSMTVTPDHRWLDVTALGDRLHQGIVASADQDVTFEEVAVLRKHDVLAADWESGAVALVCALNHVRWAVFRGVTDVPHRAGADDARRQGQDYKSNTPVVMASLFELLPDI